MMTPGTIRTGQDETMAEMTSQQQTQPVVVTQIAKAKLTLAEVQAKLAGQTGKRFWKNLDELADTDEFQELMASEFPRQSGAGEWVDAVSRRGFLKVMGASAKHILKQCAPPCRCYHRSGASD